MVRRTASHKAQYVWAPAENSLIPESRIHCPLQEVRSPGPFLTDVSHSWATLDPGMIQSPNVVSCIQETASLHAR
eukprot:44896-Pyramimonas_sp.AAC.1